MRTDIAERNGEIINIKDLQQDKDRGLTCDCSCLECGQKIIANMGEIKRRYFSHHRQKEPICTFRGETSLHKAAKEILENNNRIRLPVYNFERGCYHERRYFTYTDPKCELSFSTTLGRMVSDIHILINGKPLHIEICVTHYVDNHKLKKLQTLKEPMLEVIMKQGNFGSFISNEIQEFILDGSIGKYMRYDPDVSLYQALLREESEECYIDTLDRLFVTCIEEIEENEKNKKAYFRKKDKEQGKIGALWSDCFDSTNIFSGYVTHKGKKVPVYIGQDTFEYEGKVFHRIKTNQIGYNQRGIGAINMTEETGKMVVNNEEKAYITLKNNPISGKSNRPDLYMYLCDGSSWSY